jgi:release factor glutamine methyltransferase
LPAVPEVWTTLKVLEWTAKKFAERKIDTPRLDAEVLLAKVLRTNRVGLYTAFDKPLHDEELASYRELIKRRLAGEPVAYLLGEQEFWSLPLAVDQRVLVPRRDTETLVEVALRAARALPASIRVLDLCTGSGAVAIALASELPAAQVTATDASADALAVARANVERHQLGDRVTLLEGDLFAPLPAGAGFDIIVSNPPYVPRGDLAGLPPEVRAEPRLALDGGPDGLDVIRRLVAAAPAFLAAGGALAVEHGFDQGEPVRALFTRAGLVEVATARDLAGQERITAGRKVAPADPHR